MRFTKKFIAGAALAGAFVAANEAQAQVSFTTQGIFNSAFAGCNGGPVCTGGGFTLTYAPSAGNNIGSGSTINIGSFDLVGSGLATVPPGAITFTLIINQTQPTAGTSSFLGTMAGSVQTQPPAATNESTLEWDVAPGARLINIGPVSYQLVIDAVGYAANQGVSIGINAPRSIEALVTVNAVPEPSTYALMGSGLLGLVGVARRRRTA